MKNIPRVILDPGHGGVNPVTGKPVTPGKRSPDGRFIEGQEAFRLAVPVAAHLVAAGVDVAFSRRDFEDVPLGERVKVARMRNDVWVSLHSNASGDKWDDANRGHIVFYYPGSRHGKAMAEEVSQALESFIPARRKPEPRKLFVLRHTPGPAIYVEVGFHTSRRDVDLMRQHRPDIALRIAHGVLRYLGNISEEA